MYKKTPILLVILLLSISISLTGCFDQREVDDLAYVIGIGLDKGTTNALKVTLQIAVPTVIAGEGGEGGKAVTHVILEAPSLFSALNMSNTYVSKQLNISHAKIIVFSKELAMEGIEKYVYAFSRPREFRPHIFIAVARDSAEDYLKNSAPVLESNPGKYYESLFRGYTYTGFTDNTQLHYFLLQQKSLSQQPFAVLAAVNTHEKVEDFTAENATTEEKDIDRPLDQPMEGDFKAGDLPKISQMKSEIIGLAVFDGHKMVGELDGEETLFHLMTSGKFNYAFFSLPDPQDQDKHLIVNVSQSRPPNHKVKMINDKPEIHVKIMLEGDIVAIQSGINYEGLDNLPTLEKAYEDYFQEGVLNYLNKTARELHSDICGFGNQYKTKFSTWKEWEEANWLSRYKYAVFHVDVEMRVRRPGLIIRSTPIQSSEGGE